MKAERIFVKLEEVKHEFYHRYEDQQFDLEKYHMVAAGVTAWLKAKRPGAIGGFWSGEMRPSLELTEVTELGIVYFVNSAEQPGDKGEGEAAKSGE